MAVVVEHLYSFVIHSMARANLNKIEKFVTIFRNVRFKCNAKVPN